MKEYPFEHDGPVYLIEDDTYEAAYYARDGKKYRRVRLPLYTTWDNPSEKEIDADTFWMVVACIERSNRRA